MKKVFVLIAVMTALIACNNKVDNSTTEEVVDTLVNISSVDSVAQISE